MTETPDFQTIRYEQPADGVARIVLDRPKARNAQNKAMTYELNTAFDRAALDPDVKVIVLAADGPHFSSGPRPAGPGADVGLRAGRHLG